MDMGVLQRGSGITETERQEEVKASQRVDGMSRDTPA